MVSAGRKDRQFVVVIAPHADDEVLGCGGTIAQHVERGDHVAVVVVADRVDRYPGVRERVVEQEREGAKRAQSVLGYQRLVFVGLEATHVETVGMEVLVTRFERLLSERLPDVTYIPNGTDSHQDHRFVYKAACTAMRTVGPTPVGCILMYETLSSTDQSLVAAAQRFVPNRHVVIGEEALDRKLDALRMYPKELHQFPHSRSVDGVTYLARVRGMECGSEAAEAFMVLRWWDGVWKS